jgi:hypothetical protein
MKESQIQQLFGKNNKIYGIFELKLARGNVLPFDSVKQHQIEGLINVASNNGLYHKISDSPWTQRFTKKKPFDCFNLRNQDSYVVICWYQPRQKKAFHYIRIQDYIREIQISDRKSLTKSRSSIISKIKMIL